MPVTTRGSRRKAEGDSPLRTLSTPPKRTRKGKAATPAQQAVSNDVQASKDPGAGIFFSMPPISLPAEDQASIVDALRARIRELEDAVDASNSALTESQQETNILRQETQSLRQEITILKDSASSKQIKGNQDLQYDDSSFQQPVASPIMGPIQGTPSALELLKKIEDNAKAVAPQVQAHNVEIESPLSQDSPMGEAAQPATETELETSSKSSEAKAPATPDPPTSKRGSMFGFGRLWSSLSTAFTPNRATSPSTTHDAPTQDSSTQDSSQVSAVMDEITVALTPTPSIVREPRKQTKKKRTKGHRQAMIKKIANSVNDPAEKAKAEAWAKDVLTKLPKDSATLGDKRKRLEHGVKIGDLKKVQGTKPWKSGCYGLDDDILDLSDDEDAPAWAVLQEMLLEEQENQPPGKKHKTDHEVVIDEVTSLNDTVIPALSEPAPPTVVNTNGNSASLFDLRPRSSILPSPMFESPAMHKEGGNVFGELQGHSAQAGERAALKRAALKRSLQKTPPKCFGSFSVPDDTDSSDDEEDLNESSANGAGASSLWTQQPPPAPVPAHASLPTPLAESPMMPEASPVKAIDPVELQRAKITKHTPAKPSRLREVHVPSPSLKSDAGDITMFTASPLNDITKLTASPIKESVQVTELVLDFSGMPNAQPLDLPEEVMAPLQAYVQTPAFQADCDAMVWDDPILTYSDDETPSV